MSHTIDLMPSASRARLRSRAAARRVVVLFVGTATLAISLSLVLHLVAAARRVELARLQKDTRIHADIAERLEEVRTQATAELASLRRYARAATPVAFSDLVAVAGAIMPENVSLTSLSISPRIERTARGAGRIVGALNVEFAGLAPTDLEVATFVAGLEAHSLFERVTIERAKAVTIGGAEGREFSVTCEVELASRRIVRDAFADFQGETAAR